MNKKIILAAVAITIVGVSIFGTTNTYAQSSTSDPVVSLVQKIADKFNLNKNDVQDVFDQYRKDQQSKMEANYAKQLDQFVKDGKITDAQKQLILQKHKEMETKMQDVMKNKQNMTPEQRKAEMAKQKQDLDAWATQNGIDLQYLFPHKFGMKGEGKGWGMMRGHFKSAQ